MTQVYEQKRITKHDKCPVELRVSGPHIGLYCSCHNKWLKWITDGEARIALEAGVQVKLIPIKKAQTGDTKPKDTQYIKLLNKDKHRLKSRQARQKRRHQAKTNKG